MAYVSKEKKATIAAALKLAMEEYPTVKYSLSIRDHSTIVCLISKGPEFLAPDGKDYADVNTHWIHANYDNEARKLLTLIKDCLNIKNYDNSHAESDYFSVGHYISICIGKWDKPYIVV